MPALIDSLRIGGSFGLLAAAPTLLALSSVPQSGQAAVLFDPWLEHSALVAQVAESGADLVRFDGAPGVVVVDLPHDGPAALRRAGAWLVLDPVILGGCAADQPL